MTSLVSVPGSVEATPTADERWAAWLARGAEHDRKLNTRAIVIGSVLGAGVATWLTIALMFQ